MSIKTIYQWCGSLACVAGVGLGCAAQQPRAEHTAAVTESAPEVEAVSDAPACVDDKDEPVQCLADTDCCDGFVCGKDPERSHRVSYCIYGG